MRKWNGPALAGAVGLAFVAGLLLVSLGVAAERHVICHFDGKDGTTKFQRIEAAGINGHFVNNTTPKAGHEDDILDPPDGVCPGEEPEPTPDPTPEPTPEPTP